MASSPVAVVVWLLASSAGATDSDVSAAVYPATVLEHELTVTVTGSSVRSTEEWKVRVDDPAVGQAGITAPPGLEGASSEGARVVDGWLHTPASASPGAVYTLARTTTGRSVGGASGQFVTVGGLPVEHVRVSVRADRPLTLWSDRRATPIYTGYSGAAEWTDVSADEPAELVWSTWTDWEEAGAATFGSVDSKVGRAWELGQAIGDGVSGIGLHAAVRRVVDNIEVTDGDLGSWGSVRDAADVASAKSGDAAERALVLLSLLRHVGHDARPVMFGGAGSQAPMTVVVPGLLVHPGVAVVRDDGIVWIDPMASWASVDQLSDSMANGAVLWVEGDHPVRLTSATSASGRVEITGRMQMATDGTGSFTLAVAAQGTALERMRQLLGPMTRAERSTLFEGLIRQVRPEVQRMSVTVTGADDPRKPLRIALQGVEPGACGRMGPGLSASIPALLAPALAMWMEPGVPIREEVTVRGVHDLVPLMGRPTVPPHHDDVLYTRSLLEQGGGAVLYTEVERRYRSGSSTRDASALAYIGEQGRVGADLLLMEPPTLNTWVQLRTERSATDLDLAVIAALLWFKAGEPVHGNRAMRRALRKGSGEDIAAIMNRRGDAGDRRPWITLLKLADDERGKLAAIRGLEDRGATREAWLAAASMARGAVDVAVAVEAARILARLQPLERPDPSDVFGYNAWMTPDAVMVDAMEALDAAPVAGTLHLEFQLVAARMSLREGNPAQAEVDLELLLDHPEFAGLATVLMAEVGRQSGLTQAELVGIIERGVELAPTDHKVATLASSVYAEMGQPEPALSYASLAARLAVDDLGAWRVAVERALAAGDLATALSAAWRCASLDGAETSDAERLMRLGIAAADRSAAEAGARAGGGRMNTTWPPSLAEALAAVGPEGALAALVYRDAEVIRDPKYLAQRAQLLLAVGDVNGAARDGSLLAKTPEEPGGMVLVLAGVAGNLATKRTEALLDAVAPADRAARMEYALVLGVGDAAEDARQLPGDPRAEVVRRLADDPDGLVADSEGFPGDLRDPHLSRPTGFVSNALLGAADGVVAHSNPSLAMTVLRVNTIGTLPPPLSQLFTPMEPALSRLDGGGQVLRLDGGPAPLYAAVVIGDGYETYGLAYSAEGAERALRLARGD